MTIPPRTRPSWQREKSWHEPLVGDRPRFSFVTRILFEDPEMMPLDAKGGRKNAAAGIDNVTGEYILLLRNDLDVAVRKAEIRKLREQLRHAGAGRLTAWWLLTAAGVHQIGGAYLRVRMAGARADLGDAIVAHAGAAAATTLAVIGGLVTAGVVAGSGGPGGVAIGSPRWHQLHPVHVTLPAKPLAYLGAFEQTSPYSYSGMETFARTCGRQPNLALYYSGWFERFQAGFAREAASHGAIPLVQIAPVLNAAPGVPGQAVPLASIAAGAYDSYLVSYADQVASYGKAVVIGFGHEMNGRWYSWGYGHQPATDFVAAWQHIVDVFRRQGADNVTWLWTVNRATTTGPASHRTGPLSSYWPGAGYVTWVGVDGYYQKTDDTWDSVFGPTITQIQRFTSVPLLIAETAIGPVGTEPWQLNDIYATIRRDKYLGLVWFDENKSAHLSYRLEGDPRDSAVFRQLTSAWRALVRQRDASPGTGGG